MARLIPKGCVVHAINLDRGGAEVRFRCADDRGQKEYRDSDGSISNYPSRRVRGVRTVRLGSASISGNASVHAFMNCARAGTVISCKPQTAGEFGGYSKKRRSRRRGR